MEDLFYIQWHITNLCNLRCKHCYQEDFSKGSDLDWPGLKEIADNLVDTMRGWDKKACIHVTGGEPLLKPELFPLLAYLDQEERVGELGLITNGLCFDRDLVKRLSDFSKLRKIKISLDGASAEVNDSIRQRGAFETVVKTLPLIQGERRFEIIFMFTVMKSNLKDLPSYLNLCQERGVHGMMIERFIPWGRGRRIIGEVLDQDEWNEVVQTLLRYFSIESDGDHPLPCQAFQVNFDGTEMELQGAPCVVGVDGLCVMPEGSVLPCRRFPISIGNLLENSLKQLWENSALLKTLKDKKNLKGQCGRCRVPHCRGCRSLVFSLTGDYLGEDPHCRHHPESDRKQGP